MSGMHRMDKPSVEKDRNVTSWIPWEKSQNGPSYLNDIQHTAHWVNVQLADLKSGTIDIN